MRSSASIFLRRSILAILVGCILLVGTALILKSLGIYMTRKDTIKSSLAKGVIACLRESPNNQTLSCDTIFANVFTELKELQFQIWILEPDGRSVWQNTQAAPPLIKTVFGAEATSGFIQIEEGQKWFPILSVPSGYFDDTVLQKRVVIGDLLEGNDLHYLRNAFLILTLSVFAFGVVLALGITYLSLSKRALEARRVLAAMRSGDLSVRFRSNKMDELSDLSFSFNQMVDLLAKSLAEIQTSEIKRRELIGELSHDLRTPLTSIKSFVQLLQPDTHKKSALEKECIDSIAAEVNYLARLVDSLFELSQLENPFRRIEMAPLKINLLLEEVGREFRLPSQEKKIAISVFLPKREFWVRGDALLLKRMLLNLIENALRYAKSSLVIKGKEINGRFEIDILDDGPGFSAEALENYGIKHGKRNLSLQTAETHVGLGSIIARKIIELHEGAMTIDNRIEGGARVSITVALATSSKVNAKAELQP